MKLKEDVVKPSIKSKKQVKLERKKQKYYEKYAISIDEVNEALAKKKFKNNIKKKENSLFNNKKIIKKDEAQLKSNQEQEKITKLETSRFYPFYFEQKKYIIAIVLLSLIIIVFTFLSVPTLQYAVDFITEGEYLYAIYALLVLLAIEIGSNIVNGAIQTQIGRLNNNAAHNIRLDICSRVLNTSSSAYRKISTGEIVQRSSSEPNSFVLNISNAWLNFADFLRALVVVFYFFFLNVWIGTIVLLICIIDFILLRIRRKYRASRFMRSSLLNEKSANHITEFVRGSDDVKSLNLKGTMLSVMNKWSMARRNSDINLRDFESSTHRLINIFRDIMVMACLIVGVYFMWQGILSLSVLVVLIRYKDIPSNLSICLNSSMIGIQNANISALRMAQVYDSEKYPQEKFGTQDIADLNGGVKFCDVVFEYDDVPVLNHISFEVKAGNTLGIVGRSGEGKSTILSLINRLNDPKSGQILLDGIDNKCLTEQSLRNIVSLVPQMPYIFNTTIRENMLYANPKATEEEMIDALKMSQLYDFVKSKPDGLDTILGEGDITLSGGQRQRLAIARAFLTDCKLLMLDEATSALDNENQEEIKKVIKNLKSKCTFIIVAHRLSTIADCDEILVIDNHQIVAKGKHADLIKNCEIYKDLYMLEDGSK